MTNSDLSSSDWEHSFVSRLRPRWVGHERFAQCLVFSPLETVIDEAVAFLQSDSLLLVTTADLSSIIALGFLESALLDRGITYSRRILPPNAHIPPDELDLVPKQAEANVLFIDAWNRVETPIQMPSFDPQPVEVEFSNSSKKTR